MAYSSFIDTTYFVGEKNIPNRTSNATLITQIISQYEKEILISALGYRLYSLLVADCTGEGGVPVTQKYIDLVNGAEFTHESQVNGEITLKWEGLKNTSKESLIAYYAYYKYLERETLHVAGVGTVVIDTSKGKRVSPMDLMINAWDRMRSLYGIIPVKYKHYYGDLSRKGTDFNGTFNDDPSLFNFLFANETDYPDWLFKPIWGVNNFGI